MDNGSLYLSIGEHMGDDTDAKILADRSLQEERIAFERDKTAYEANVKHLLSLNQFLWQVPTIAISLTGGLWYGVTKIDFPLAREGLLLLSALSDLLLIVVVLRMRFLFGAYLSAQRGFNPKFEIKNESGPWILPSWTVVTCFILLLAAGSAGSAYGVWRFKEFSVSNQTTGKSICTDSWAG